MDYLQGQYNLGRLFHTLDSWGLPALRIGFGSIPIIISGILFGHCRRINWGVSDILGFILFIRDIILDLQ